MQLLFMDTQELGCTHAYGARVAAATASIHRAAEKKRSRKLGFRCTGFSET